MRFLLAATMVAIAVLFPVPSVADKPPPVPDLTQGGQPDKSHDWTLGPTGARGWMWGWTGHTTDARQILITEVAPSSPADGVLKKGDVLLGVDGKAFASDARLALAGAIGQAETQTGGGKLSLVRWREGKSENVQLTLAVMGTYGPTAPYNCAKSRRVFELGCDALARRGLKDVSIPNDLAALALLAGGRAEHRPLVADYARRVADHKPGGHLSWGYAYATLFLAEYAIATRDASVLPGLRRLATDIAAGQSAVGTWGHAFARPDGILGGYGCMNQPGIVLTLAMALAREAGVQAVVLDKAIEKSRVFLGWYVHKGAIPYGDHEPWAWHEDNGKCSSAAVLFDVLGQGDGAGFFSRMGTAAHSERESGHTGCFFNVTWALPGVSRAGRAATAAYFRETAWYYDLARTHDGRLIYQPIPGDWGGHSYGNWDCTGAYLLGYALPLRSLRITGSKPPACPPLTAPEVADTIAAGRDFTFWTQKTCYEGRDARTLLAGLSSWSPAVRKRSAHALARLEGDFVPALVKQMASPGRDARYGAIEALGRLGPRADAAAPPLRAALNDADPWIRCLAADALARLSEPERAKSAPDLLRLAARNDSFADPRNRVQSTLGESLFSTGPGKGEPRPILDKTLEGVDRDLLYAALRSMLRNQDGRVRGLISRVYDKLTAQDLAQLMPDIVRAIREPAASGEMFADSIRLSGLDVLARCAIREGMDLCVDLMEPERWGQDHRVQRCLSILGRYGAHARPLLPRLRQMREDLLKRNRRQGEKNPLIVALDKRIAEIEAAKTPAPPLRSLQEFIRSPKL